MRKSDAFPVVALVLAIVGATFLWLISDQPRMADGELSESEMGFAEKIILMTCVLGLIVSLFGSLFVAVRRAWADRSWAWLALFALAGPLAFIPYQLLVNRGDEA